MRAAAAGNPALSDQAVLAEIARTDGDVLVREAATARLRGADGQSSPHPRP